MGKRILIRTFFVLIAIGAAFIVGEGFARLRHAYLNSEADKVEFDLENPLEFHPEYGLVAKPNSTGKHIFKLNNKVIYDVVYNYDEQGLRRVVGNSSSREKFLILFGSSTSFGQGLSEEEAIPSLLAGMQDEFQIYNFTQLTVGAQSILGAVRRIVSEKTIAQKRGVFVYYYIYDHISRSYGNVSNIGWASELMHYEKNEQSRFESLGKISKARPLYYSVLLFLNQNVRLFRLPILKNFPYVTDSKEQYVVDLIAQAKEEFTTAFPEARFLLLMHGNRFFRDQNASIIRKLRDRDIDITFFQRPTVNEGSRIHRKYDRHYNASGSVIAANRMYEAISNYLKPRLSGE